MTTEYSVNEKGDAVITWTLPIPESIDPKDYDAFAALFERRLAERLRSMKNRGMLNFL